MANPDVQYLSLFSLRALYAFFQGAGPWLLVRPSLFMLLLAATLCVPSQLCCWHGVVTSAVLRGGLSGMLPAVGVATWQASVHLVSFTILSQQCSKFFGLGFLDVGRGGS